jgi:hypothetical protein
MGRPRHSVLRFGSVQFLNFLENSVSRKLEPKYASSIDGTENFVFVFWFGFGSD